MTSQTTTAPFVNDELLKNLTCSVFDCTNDNAFTCTAVVVAPQTQTITVYQQVCETAKKVVSAVVGTAKKAAAKTLGFLGSCWNKTKSFFCSGYAYAKAGVQTVAEFVTEKAACFAIGVYLISLVIYMKSKQLCGQVKAKTISVYQGVKGFIATKTGQAVASCKSTYAWSKAKASELYATAKTYAIKTKDFVIEKSIAAATWTKRQYNRFIAWSVQTWINSKPLLNQATKIGIVALALYCFANAAVLATCILVATLGVTAYDRAYTSLLNRTSQPAKNQKVPSQPVFPFLA